jgi:hypothetical protein
LPLKRIKSEGRKKKKRPKVVRREWTAFLVRTELLAALNIRQECRYPEGNTGAAMVQGGFPGKIFVACVVCGSF